MSNYNKTICDHCYQGTWYETEQPCKRTIFDGCKECGSHENVSNERRCPGTLRVIDTRGLDDRFTQFYKSGERVEVTYKWGEKERFYIGKSTGWKPCYLGIKRSDSMGGMAILASSITKIQPLGVYKH